MNESQEHCVEQKQPDKRAYIYDYVKFRNKQNEQINIEVKMAVTPWG